MSDKYTSYEMALEKPSLMGTETFAENNAELFIAYAKLRVHGTHPSVAFRRLFGDAMWDSFSQSRIYAVESTELYQNEFRRLLLETPIRELWNDRLAIHKLLSIANDVFEKGSTRLRAVQELNILIGVTVVDENGKTRKGSTMADFYTDIGTESKRGSAQLPESFATENEQGE